ncbi:MAG: RNA-guided endonuclease TnpB family protein [Prochloraceae cyanobacterium]|nr:RNA-guided endonuclease TnpB family protein [Prochloraceae cyanobacterium]
MIKNKAYKFRLYPNQEQEIFLAKCFGCSRFVYNHFLRLTIDTYAESKQTLKYSNYAKLLTKLKREVDYSWLKEVNSQALQQSLKDLEKAFVSFFSKQNKFPRFKKKTNRQSFRVPQHFSITEDGKLQLPKMKPIKMVIHREIEGKLCNVTISKTPGGKYYASIVVEYESELSPLQGDRIGIDVNLDKIVVTSNGDEYDNPKYLKKSLKKLTRLYRCLSRKQKDSKKRNKARLRLAKIHGKVANQRLDLHHKLSTKLCKENQLIATEDLAIKNLIKNPKLSRHIADVAWGKFLTLLGDKSEKLGCEIKKVDRFFPSSKRCHVCGWIKTDMTLKERQWKCEECHTFHDSRDRNAALNILLFANNDIPQEVRKSTPKEIPETVCISRVTD